MKEILYNFNQIISNLWNTINANFLKEGVNYETDENEQKWNTSTFDLAYNYVGLPIQVQEISNRQEIPLRFLEQIFHRLKNANIVKGVKGPNGGYLLARDPKKLQLEISLKQLKSLLM